jgi:branched-subunit amino acid aminotransferase/4-amino-4-deoxychorismate lyase
MCSLYLKIESKHRRSIAACWRADLLAADEAFLTSTTMEVMPVTTVVDERGKAHRIGSGRAGAAARMLRRDYRDLVKRITNKG